MNLDVLYVCENVHSSVDEVYTQSLIHQHDHPELSIMLTGKAHYTINGDAYTLKAGDLVLFGANVPHSVEIPKQPQYRDLHIGTPELVDNALLPTAQQFVILRMSSSTKKVFFDCLEHTVKESHSGAKDSCLMIEALVTQLLILIGRELKEGQSLPEAHKSALGYPDKNKVVTFMKGYIAENYMKDISLEMFAKDIYLSQVYISKIFKEETGYSPINYLIKTRLSKAKDLLETQNSSIKAIASAVGYEDAYHFSKLFKKYYGYPPSAVDKKKIESRLNS